MHIQSPVPDWPNALIAMPDGALIKSVNDPAILTDAVKHWLAAGRDKTKLWTGFRYHDYYYPKFDAEDKDMTWEEALTIWRMNFRKWVDGTYLSRHVNNVRLVEELNEYTDTRMVTDKALLKPRLMSAQAAAWVWNMEYRGRVVEADGIEALIPDDCRLVLCNSPVGNDVPKEYFQLSLVEDCPLGVHPYTRWENSQRDPQDFRYHSGRWYYNEQEYGIKPDYVFTESGPYAGVLEGWRHPGVMNASVELLEQGMRDWFNDLAQTSAYKEGRILGPGAWFTTGDPGTGWKYYELHISELTVLAQAATELWNPGEYIPPEPPVEPVPDCRGEPREQYRREFWVLSDTMTPQQIESVFVMAMAKRITVGWSYDDAGIGDLDDRTAVLWNIPENLEVVFIQWFVENYPGVKIEFRNTPDETNKILDIIDLLTTHPEKNYSTRPLSGITTATIHHTVSPPDRPIEQIAAYHVNTRGWPGIGYHYVINHLGEIYQTNHLDTKSYHTGTSAPGDENAYSIGIALQGDFTHDPPPQKQLDATRWLVGDLKDRFGELDVTPHRHMPGASTACPGNSYLEWFDYISG